MEETRKTCRTCDNMYMTDNYPLDDDVVCFCKIKDEYLGYPDEVKDCSCEKWVDNQE